MRSLMLGKMVAVVAMVGLLALALARIGFLVDERRQYQREAIEGVQQSFAGAQTVLGPVLQRHCVEEWDATVGVGNDRRTETNRREFTLRAVPSRLEVETESRTDLRYRGLFKVNGYAARLGLQARWADLGALLAQREHAGSRLTCQRATLWLATSDVRGVRSAQLSLGGQALVIRPGTGHDAYPNGLHAELDLFAAAGAAPNTPLDLHIALDLVGTAQLSLVPAAESTQWTLRSDWPHPSFGGRFLPNQREVGDTGFSALWSLSSLATSAPIDVRRGVPVCRVEQVSDKTCLDTLSVAFVDPVNPYTLSDRAIKYGLLFVVLTFTAVALAETLAGGRVRRVHPVQYALVGLALCLFFLLLLSLSEHLAFGLAYALASGACVALLGVYARHMLGRLRDGWLFAVGMGLLYGLLYLLLLREQTALVLGSLGLFAALALVMLLTRRVDWYRLAPLAATNSAPGSG